MGVTFTDYVNHYRINAVKERIVKPGKQTAYHRRVSL